MDLRLDNTELILHENRPLRLVNGRGIAVRCVAGTAWLTVTGEAGDIFLAPGQAHRLESDGLALAEALGKVATICLEVPRPAFSNPLSRLLAGLILTDRADVRCCR